MWNISYIWELKLTKRHSKNHNKLSLKWLLWSIMCANFFFPDSVTWQSIYFAFSHCLKTVFECFDEWSTPRKSAIYSFCVLIYRCKIHYCRHFALVTTMKELCWQLRITFQKQNSDKSKYVNATFNLRQPFENVLTSNTKLSCFHRESKRANSK